MERKGIQYVVFGMFSPSLQTAMAMFQPKVKIMHPFRKGLMREQYRGGHA